MERLRPRRRDEAALREVYDEHGPELYRFALRSLRDRGLAEEITQETFVRAWRSREDFDEERGSRRTWLFAIARNLVIDAARARKSRPAPANAETSREAEASEDHAEQTLREILVSEAMESLSVEHRFVIHEIHFRGRKYSEVAREAGIPSGTLRSRMYYALKSLRLALEEMGWPDER